jgi:serine/threonine-protein kinase
MNDPAPAPPASTVTPSLRLTFDRSELAPGDRLGNWTLRREIGSGGMGRVFLAERSDGHYEQRAAVKLLLSWNDEGGPELLARERRILATLAHPNIARLIDGGTTPLGQPYLVMEYVEGVPLHLHCRAQQLALPAVLALFQQVLQAVAAAHRQLVVHCDLKPGNVLVTPEGRAMLLDFGIARLQGASAAQDTLHDGASFTPRYASPEQRRGGRPGVASDVYSLGVMLGDLTEPLPLPRGLRRELQAIVARATAADPEHRYASVPALSDDLRRLLAHRPLQAMPRRWPYVAGKLLRRRWAWSATALAVLLLSAGFTVQLVRERDRARTAERAAVAEAAATRAVGDFVVGLFEGADPAVSGRPDMPARELVDRGRQRVDRDMDGQPALQAQMKGVLGKVYENIGSPATAIELYTQAAALAQHPDVARPLQRAALLSRLAVALSNSARPAQAEGPAREALALAEAEGDEAAIADALNTLGIVLQGLARYDEALQVLQRSLAMRERLHGTRSETVAAVLHNLSLVQRGRGQPAEAERLLRRSLAVKQAILPAAHPSTLVSLESLGRVLNELRRFDEAEAVLLQVLDLRRQLYGSDNEAMATAYNELANVLHDRGRIADALVPYREAVRIGAATGGTNSVSHAVHLNNLATALEDLGRVAEAEAAYRESLARRQALLPPGDLALVRGQHNLGRFLLRQGQPAAARPLLEQAAAVRAQRLAPSHRDRVESMLALAELAAAIADAPALRERLSELQPHVPVLNPPRVVQHTRLQARLAALQGDRVAALQQAQAAAQAAQALPAEHAERLRAELGLAQLLLEAGETPRARGLLQGLEPALATHEPTSALRQQAQGLRRRIGA